MLTFKPLKTKTLITQGNIRRRRRFFKHRGIPVKLPFNRHFSMQPSKTGLMMWKYKRQEGDNISGVKEYCIVWEDRQPARLNEEKRTKNELN